MGGSILYSKSPPGFYSFFALKKPIGLVKRPDHRMWDKADISEKGEGDGCQVRIESKSIYAHCFILFVAVDIYNML